MAKYRVAVAVIVISFFAIGAAYPQAVISMSAQRHKSYYFTSTFKLNWFKAVEYCRSRGMFLVSIADREQLNEIVKYLESSGYFITYNRLTMWTSGDDLGEEGQFYWASTGKRMTLNIWAPNEPNNQMYPGGLTENCVVLNIEKSNKGSLNSSFNDGTCPRAEYFMCETLVE